MKTWISAFLLVLPLQFAVAAEVKPGLWEMEFDSQGMSAEAQAAMKYETKIDATTSEGGQQRKVQQTLKSKWVKASCGG